MTIRHLISLMLIGISAEITYAQKLEAQKIEMASGQTATLTVGLKEAKAAYNALTLSVLFPEGIHLVGNPQVTSKWKNPLCITQEDFNWRSDSAEIQHSILQNKGITFSAIGDVDDKRTIKMAFASTTELQDTETDSLLTLCIKADDNFSSELSLLKLQTIMFEYSPSEKNLAEALSIGLSIWNLGDANRDKEVRVDDATLIINYILGKESAVEYNAMLADMNDDKVIDIFDVMKLMNVILTGKLPVSRRVMSLSTPNTVYEDMTSSFTNNGISIGIPNAERFSSFQFDIELPDDIELLDAELNDVSTDHMIQFTKVSDHYFRVLCLSANNSVLTENSANNLIKLIIPNCNKLSIQNTIFVTPQGIACHFNNLEMENGITSVNTNNISTNVSQSVYDLLGRKVRTKDGHLPKGMYIINNKRVIVK